MCPCMRAQILGEFWPSVQPFSLNGYMEVIRDQQQPEGPGEDEEDEEGDRSLLNR